VKGFKDTTKTKWICGGYAKGGAVNKVPRNMVESTSARPVRIPLDRAVPTPAERGAIDRGNRAAAMEASERAVMSPRVQRNAVSDKKPDEMARGGRARKGGQTPLINKAGPPRSLLESKACGGSPRKK
jgi:hypothetical protein